MQSLHGKLVRFECMVQDMYDEEFFMTVLLPNKYSGGDHAMDDEPSLDSNVNLKDGLFYKYFSQLSNE